MKLRKIKNVNTLLIISLITLAVVFIVICLCNNSNDEIKQADFSSINSICELSTLKCYYHNVGEYKKQPDGLFKYGLFKYGYKKFWIEYEGTVEIGIDASKVQVNTPDKKNIVKIYIPDAKITDCYVNSESISEAVSSTGVLTDITIEERTKNIAEAEKNMKKNAENDEMIFNQAKSNAKEIIKRYVMNVGKQIDQKYKVEWIDKPIKK